MKKIIHFPLRGLSAILLAGLLQTASAQTTWNSTGSGDWSTASNWLPTTVPNSTTTDAYLFPTITADSAIGVSLSATVRSIVLNSGIYGYSLSGSSLLNFAAVSNRALTNQVGSIGDESVSGVNLLAGSQGLAVTNNSGVGRLTINNLGGSFSTTGAVTYSGVGRTILTGNSWYTAATGVNTISSQANISFDNAAQLPGATTVNIAGGFAYATRIQNRSAVTFSGANYLAIGGFSSGANRLFFDAQGDLVTNAGFNTSNQGVNLYNEGSGTIYFTSGTIGNSANPGNLVLNSGAWSFGNVQFNGKDTASNRNSRFIIGGVAGYAPATVTLTGTVTAQSGTGIGGITMRSGEFIADYRSAADTKFSATNLAEGLKMGGGQITFLANDNSDVNETLAAFTVGTTSYPDNTLGGQSRLKVVSGTAATITVNLNRITQASSSTIDFSVITTGTGVANLTATNVNSNSILGAWATYQGNSWATRDGAANTAGNIGALSTFSRTDAIGTANTENVTINPSNSVTFSSAIGGTANTVHLSSSGTVDFGGRRFVSNGILLTSTAGVSPTVINGVGSVFSPGIVQQWNTAAPLIFESALTGGITKAGPGTLRLAASSSMTGASMINSGTIELAADNALGTGAVDWRAGSFMKAVGGERFLPNNTSRDTTQFSGGFKGVGFIGSENIVLGGVWEAIDQSGQYHPISTFTVNNEATSSIKLGSPTVKTASVVLGDSNSGGGILINGTGAGKMQFYGPLMGSPQTPGAMGTVTIDRTDGLTTFEQSNSIGQVVIRQGVLIANGTTAAPSLTPSSISFAAGLNTGTMDLATAALVQVGQSFKNAGTTSGTFDKTAIPIGSWITSIDRSTGVFTISQNFGRSYLNFTGSTGLINQQVITGTNGAVIEPKGVLSVGNDIPFLPVGSGTAVFIDPSSRGVIGVDAASYTQNINMSNLGSNALWLGSAVSGTITGGALTAGTNATYRLGGGGGNLNINTANYLTGANHVVVGDSDLFKANQTAINILQPQDYTGRTVVRAGLFKVNAAISGAGAIEVQAGATLSGTGSMAGALSVSGTVKPGDSLGAFTISNSVTFKSGGTLAINLDANGATASSLSLTGALDLSAGGDSLTVALLNAVPADGSSFVLATYDSVNGTFSNVSVQGMTPGSYTLEYGTHALTLVIPEPGTLLLALSGLGFLVARRRGRNR